MIPLKTASALRVVAARGPGRAKVLGATVDVGAPIAGLVAETKKPLWSTDITADPTLTPPVRESGSPARYRGKSLISVPWVAEDQVVGVLNLCSRPGHQFSAADVARVTKAAGTVATVLQQLMHAEAETAPPPLWGRAAFQLLPQATPAPVALHSVNAVLDLVDHAVVCFDPDGIITWLNHATTTIFPGHHGWIGSSIWALPVQVPAADWISFLETGLATGAFPTQQDLGVGDDADGTSRRMQCRGALFRRGDGAVDGGCLLFADHTTEVQLGARLDAAAKESALGRMLSEVAHELRNPLDSARRLVRLARRDPADTAAVDAHLDDALRAMTRMMSIVKEVLVFSRREGRIRRIDSLPLTQVLDRYFADWTATERYPNVRIIRDYGSLGPGISYADFTAILDNLVTNGCEAMDGEGTLVIYGHAETDRYVLEIQDTGPGVPPELQERIFEPFFTTKPYGQGTGLGLALCRKILRTHQGALTCTSDAGVGATFRVELPLTPVAGPERE